MCRPMRFVCMSSHNLPAPYQLPGGPLLIISIGLAAHTVPIHNYHITYYICSFTNSTGAMDETLKIELEKQATALKGF